MKPVNHIQVWTVALILVTGGCQNPKNQADPCKEAGTEHYSAVEIDNVLCGYAVDRQCLVTEKEKEILYQSGEVMLKLTILDQGVDVRINLLFRLDPKTDRWFYNKSMIDNGSARLETSTEIRGDTAYFETNQGISRKKVFLPTGTELATSTSYPYLVRDFIKAGKTDSSYRVYDFMSGAIADKQYIKKSEEDILLNDSAYNSIVVEETDNSTGVKTTIWLESATGFPLKYLVAGRNIYLADRSVVGRITKVNYDNVIFARVNKLIPEFRHLTYMNVRARIESAGEVLSVGGLNRPGQKFKGTVNDNLIDGVFELERIRYDGAGAPPFPPDFNQQPELKKYLEPERLIESNEQMIVEEARRITEGSKDSWEAATRLSKWVSENIEGAIPGGTSAINTYKTRQGECGSHSRLLAALCRAVGIPARLSIGCSYTTLYHGSSGQHAWNEVFMGEAGWIAIDATFYENDYIDAGHIRLGEALTFMPREMEILEYSMGNIK